MPISTTTSRITYAGDGVTVAFAVPFVFFGADELEVVERVIASGVETTKTLTTHYSVAGGNGTTGTVTAVVSPAAAVSWTIARKTKRTQLVEYPVNDPFPAKTHERALDRLTALAQELDDNLSRAARLSVTTSLSSLILPDPVADQVLGWKGDLSGLENKVLVPASSVVAASIAGTRAGATAAEFVTPRGLASLWQAGSNLISAASIAKPADANLGGVYRQTGSTTTDNYWAGSVDGEELEVYYVNAPIISIAGNILPPNNAAFQVTAGAKLKYRWDSSVSKWRFFYGSNQDGTPLVAPAVRERLLANRTYYVRTDGNDANTGLVDSAGGAFLTLTAARNAVRALDFNGFIVTVQVRDGTYTAPFDLSGPLVGAYSSDNLVIKGNAATPANVIINCTSPVAGADFIASNGARYTVQDMELRTTTAGFCLYALGGGAEIRYSNVRFGACASYHVSAAYNSLIFQNGPCFITGAAIRHWNAQSPGAYIYAGGQTITISGTPAITLFGAAAEQSMITCNGMTFPGTGVTGTRYSATLNGIINTSGGGATYLPGSVAGSVATQGQYV